MCFVSAEQSLGSGSVGSWDIQRGEIINGRLLFCFPVGFATSERRATCKQPRVMGSARHGAPAAPSTARFSAWSFQGFWSSPDTQNPGVPQKLLRHKSLKGWEISSRSPWDKHPGDALEKLVPAASNIGISTNFTAQIPPKFKFPSLQSPCF